MRFLCRYAMPGSPKTEWATVNSDTKESAVMDFHHVCDRGMVYTHYLNAEKTRKENITFACVAVKAELDLGDGEEFIARNYFSKIWRSGGVKRPEHDVTLAEITEKLGYTFEPETLLEKGWDEESESWD